MALSRPRPAARTAAPARAESASRPRSTSRTKSATGSAAASPRRATATSTAPSRRASGSGAADAARRRPRSAPAKDAQRPALGGDEPFSAVVRAFAKAPAVELGPGWGTGNLVLKVESKIFAMCIDGELVVKLPRARVAEETARSTGRPFDPRKNGRVMKEWLVVPPHRASWSALAREAHAFVAGAR